MKKNLFNFLVLTLFFHLSEVKAQFCTGTTNLTTASGTFSDGSGTANYNNATNCSWLIQPNGATSITLTFQNIDVEACCDSVIFYDGPNASASVLGTYAGTAIPPAITSTGGSVFVRFTSNATNTAQGWTISYNACITPSVFAMPDSICAGGTTQLKVLSGNLVENFDPVVSSQWTILNGTVNTTCGSVSGNALYFDGDGERSATTVPLNVVAGGTIDFNLKISNGLTPCEQVDAGEEVVLEYSIDNGVTWVNINTYNTGLTYANFTLVSESIPAAAQTNATLFKWRQINHTGLGYDNWALDDINLNSGSASTTYAWSPATGLSSTSIDNPTATLNATTTYTVLVSDANCSESATVTVHVVPPTQATITASGSTNVCTGDSITLTANAGLSYLWSTGDTTQSIVVSQNGSFSVAIDYGYACNSTSATTNVVVVPLPAVPTVTTSGSPTVCDSSIVVLTSSTGANYTYQWNKFGSLITGAQSSTFNAQTGGDYSVTVFDNNACSSTSATVTIDDLTPSFSIAPLPSLICAGATVQLDVLNGIQEDFDPISPLNWNIVGGSVSDTCGSVSGNALYFNGASTRTLTSNNLNLSSGGSVSFSLEIANGSAPCEQADAGEEVVLEYSINNGTTWTIINTYQVGNFANFTTVNEAIPAAAQTVTTLLRWRQLSNSGNTYDNWSLDNINILVSGSSAYNYSWSPATGLSSTTIANPTATVNATTTYTLTVSSASCTATTNVTIAVNPATQATITANDSTVFCANDSVILTANPGVSYLWSNGDTTQSISVNQTGNYTVAIDYGFACNSTSAATSITVLPLPTTPTVSNTGSTNLCNGTSTALSTPPGANLTYQWNKNGSIISGAQSSTYTANTGGEYTVTVTDANNCSATSSDLTVTDLTPIFSVTATPSIICQGANVQLNVSTGFIENFDPINSANWTIVGGTISDSCGSVTGNALYFNGNSTRTATTNIINLNSISTISFALKISNEFTTICEQADAGEEVVLEYSINNGTTWTIINTYQVGGVYANFTNIIETIPLAAQTNASRLRWRQLSFSGTGTDNWALDNVQIGNGASNFTYNWTPVQGLSSTTVANPNSSYGQTNTYTVEVTSGGSCTATSSINVVATPTINITASQINTICDTCCTGSATANVTGGLAPLTYVWSPAPQGGQGTATATGLCVGSYLVTVTDSIGCSSFYGVFISIANGINESEALNSLAIYPNPTKGNFTLKRNADLNEKLVVQFMNALGEEIFVDELSATTSSKLYEIDHLSSGIYFVRIQNASGDSKVIRVEKN
jgi:hypothetical protein